jgi:hypothetical protein
MGNAHVEVAVSMADPEIRDSSPIGAAPADTIPPVGSIDVDVDVDARGKALAGLVSEIADGAGLQPARDPSHCTWR